MTIIEVMTRRMMRHIEYQMLYGPELVRVAHDLKSYPVPDRSNIPPAQPYLSGYCGPFIKLSC